MATLLKVLNNLADIKSAGGVALCVRTQALAVLDGLMREREGDYDYVFASERGGCLLASAS